MSGIAPHLPGLAAALGFFALGFLVIGPNIAAIMATSMQRGRAQGLRMAVGVGIGSGLWATLTVMGLASIVTAYAGAMTVLRGVGVALLAWLAWKAFRAAASSAPPAQGRAARGDPLLAGLAIQMTNPKAALQWIAIASLAMSGEAPWQIGAALVASATALSLMGHAAYALMFSTVAVRAGYVRARRWIEGTLGMVFSAFALRLAIQRD